MSKLGGILILSFILWFILRGMMPRVVVRRGPPGPDPRGPGPGSAGVPPGDVIDVEVIEKDSK